MNKSFCSKRLTPPGRLWSFHCLAVYSLIAARDAHAYLDPATGSLLIQILVGAVLGASLTVKMWWFRVKELFARMFGVFRRDTNHGESEED